MHQEYIKAVPSIYYRIERKEHIRNFL